jgi:hypothetical protein
VFHSLLFLQREDSKNYRNNTHGKRQNLLFEQTKPKNIANGRDNLVAENG